jgi:hypothetical protein
MPSVDEILAEVDALITSVKPIEAEDRLQSVISTMGPAELRVWEPDLRRTIDHFLPKRRKTLTAFLDKNLQAEEAPLSTVSAPKGDIQFAIDSLKIELKELYDYHIFQWSTFYRDRLGEFFGLFVDESAGADLQGASESVRQLLQEHTRESFLKGYFHRTRFDTHQHSLAKTVSGLQRFLDLPLEFYSARLSTELRKSDALALRYLTSGMLCGIIAGYSELKFPNVTGHELLAEYRNLWVHTVTFMTADHAEAALSVVNDDGFTRSAAAAIMPLVRTLDYLAQNATDQDYIPLPALSQFISPRRRLDISLRPPPYSPRPIEIQCYLDPAVVFEDSLSEASTRNLGALVAPLRPSLRTFLAKHEEINRIVAPILDDDAKEDSTSTRLRDILESAIYRPRGPHLGTGVLEYNFAKEFPLQNPFLTRYYHVYRTSVRDLLRTFERRNGVRLWCSVRRSGKTTAGIDLGTTTGESNVISQTCDSTGQLADGSIIYDTVCEALASSSQLPNDFFQQTVNRCMTSGQTPEHRTVVVLDEYETLFGRLSTAVHHELGLRYTVVQPLLNQMVAFTRDNLIVFLGQQPTAHYILMDQNQLSAYVQQDAFPLFTHSDSSADEEFAELLQRILSDRVHFDRSFVNRVFLETAGHPWLTANLMVDFVDWLISSKRTINSLSFDETDMSSFASRRLRRDRISVSRQYQFFRDAAIPQALSANGRRQNPWLYSIYSVIRRIVIENPESFVCSRDEFVDMVQRLGIGDLGLTPDLLLTTGEQANFLTFNDRSVAPRIRLLGRIAAVATAEVNP